MVKLVLRISNGQVHCNNRYTLDLRKTDIPWEHGAYRDDFYWSAEILRYRDDLQMLEARIVNYDATEEEFVGAVEVPYRFSYIRFGSFDQSEILSCIGGQSPPTPSQQEEPFLKPKTLYERGDLVDRCVCYAKAKDIGTGDQYLTYDFQDKGKTIRLKMSPFPVTRHTMLRNADFIEAIGKEEAEITVYLYENETIGVSVDLDKICYEKDKNTPAETTNKEPQAVSSPRYSPSTQRGDAFSIAAKLFPAATIPSFSTSKQWNPSPEPVATWKEYREEVKVKFSDLTYAEGYVQIQYSCASTKKKLVAIINNQVIEPELKYVTKYFSKVFSKTTITATIVLRRQEDGLGRVLNSEILSAKSADIDKIDSKMISNIEGTYCVDHLFSPREDSGLESVDDLLREIKKNPERVSAPQLIDLVVEKRPDSKHALQLRYLASKHLAEKMPLKIEREPKAFLFLVQGAASLYLVLETVEARLATYVWVCPENEPELGERVKELESIITTIEKNRNAYKKTKPENFFFITHKYNQEEEDFIDWQERLQAIII